MNSEKDIYSINRLSVWSIATENKLALLCSHK